MSVPPDWITDDDVAAWLDLLPADINEDNLALATALVKSAVEERRSDLYTGEPPMFTPTDQVKNGAVIWAGLVYQLRNKAGSAVVSDETLMFGALGARRADVMQWLGWHRPEFA